jgi:NAD+ kinase
MSPIRKIAFAVNAAKPGASALARELAAVARAEGVRIKSTSRVRLERGYLRGCDACCVIGGDGTLLGIAREAAMAQVPLIGVNCGSLGFLTTFSPDEARSHFRSLLQGAYRVDRRAMLGASFGAAAPDIALNDVLVKSKSNSRLIRLEVFADDELVTDYVCDGLIFSTVTGSTAYNLSAGGPIIHPAARVIVMTPICPHTLSNRSVIFRENVRIRVFNRSEGSRLFVAMDGQRNLKPREGLPVRISLSGRRLPLVQQIGYSHFSVVRTKLNWSGGVSGKR